MALFASPAQAETYEASCSLGGATPGQFEFTVEGEVPEEAVPAGSTFTLSGLTMTRGAAADNMVNTVLTIAGQEEGVDMGEVHHVQNGHANHFGPVDAELTAPSEEGTYDLVPETVTFEIAIFQGVCEFPEDAAPFASVTVGPGDDDDDHGHDNDDHDDDDDPDDPDGDDDDTAPPPATPVTGAPSFTG